MITDDSTVCERSVATGVDDGVGTGVLLIQCPDRPGIVAHVSGFLSAIGANIVEMTQFSTGGTANTFFQRTVFRFPDLDPTIVAVQERFQKEVAGRFQMNWQLTSAAGRPRIAVMVSRHEHCLLDLLWQARGNDLPCDIDLVIGNHPNTAEVVHQHGVPFVHIPTPRGAKAVFEEQQLELLRGQFDLVVLARYMQVLTEKFLTEVGCPVININHSFLPAFMGADPYSQAKERGVKVIGATAHYATAELDDGPIIEQDTARVSHTQTADDLRKIGADIERTVLTRAVRWHCEHRVRRFGNATVVL